MVCPKCKSDSITIQVVNEQQLKRKHHSIIWWICIGWWFVPVMWLLFFLPKIVLKLFRIEHKPQKIINSTKKKAVCQTCGNVFDM